MLLRGDDGLERVYCHHASDPLGDGHSHDAFSAWLILEHGGDMKAAVRAAAINLGMSYKAALRASQGAKAAQTERRTASKQRPCSHVWPT